MSRGDSTSTAGPTIAEVFREFLAEQRPILAVKTLRRYEEIVELFEHCLNSSAYQSLDKRESERFDRLYNASGAEHREFCEAFGPEHILPNVGEFLGYFMVRKVIAGKETRRAAGVVTKKLAKWLAEKGYVKTSDAAEAAQRGGAAARDLPKAEELASLLREFADEQDRGDEEDEIEDHFTLTRVEPGKVWLQGMARGSDLGPIKVSGEISRRCRVGWSISGVVGRAGKKWRLVEAWNVYPD